MPDYIDPAVARLRESDAETTVTLLLGVEGDREAATRTIERTGATIEAELGRATLRVTAPESAVDDLATLAPVSSIELEREDARVVDDPGSITDPTRI
ncbi:hypothetical protein ACFQAS_07920 [Halopenitus salinus]|uniref:Putative peptidase inhibitor domain-containing protein n=1 Tax=Halopenitus salinus TaxID=1198295 RepID=A0ABD5UZP5_9EURY